MKTSDKTDLLYKAMVKARKELPAIGKKSTAKVPTKKGGSFSYSYASLDVIAETIDPILAKHGLMLSTGGGECEGNQVAITTRLVHESGQWMESTLLMVPSDRDPQGIGSCITYGSRYGYRLVGVVTEDDDDGAWASIKDKNKKKPPAASQKQKPPERTWVDVCKSNPDIADMYKKLKMGKNAGNAVWAYCKKKHTKQDDREQEFCDRVKKKFDETSDPLPLENTNKGVK